MRFCLQLAVWTVSSLCYGKLGIYSALIVAMVCGRLVSGGAHFFLLGLKGMPYGLEAFISASFVLALPGIILQLLLIPVLVKIIERAAVYMEK